MVSVNAGSSTVRYLFDGNTGLKFISSLSLTTLNFSFSTATILTHILIQNHNIDEMYVYYNNTTSNCLFMTCSNTAKNILISFNSLTVSSIQITLARTMGFASQQKIGEISLCEKKLSLTSLPAIRDFDSKLDRHQIVHEMPDGGQSVYNIRDNYIAKLRYKFISSSFKDSLQTIYDGGSSFYFVQKPTDTSWDGRAFEVDWVGAFDFEPSINVESPGWTGTLNLKQTSRAR